MNNLRNLKYSLSHGDGSEFENNNSCDSDSRTGFTLKRTGEYLYVCADIFLHENVVRKGVAVLGFAAAPIVAVTYFSTAGRFKRELSERSRLEEFLYID